MDNVLAASPSPRPMVPVSYHDSYALKRTAELLRREQEAHPVPGARECLALMSQMADAMAAGDAGTFHRNLYLLGRR